MKIFVAANNYEAHNKAQEFSLFTESEPVVYTKADSALLKDRKPFFIPDWSDEVDAEAHLAVRICRLGKSIPERFAHRYYDAVTLGVCFTTRDLLDEAIRKGRPWEMATGFDGSAVIGQWVEKDKFRSPEAVRFSLKVNETVVMEGQTSDMLCRIDALISRISRLYTLKTGDILFTGSPLKAVKVNIDDRLAGYVEDRLTTEFNCK